MENGQFHLGDASDDLSALERGLDDAFESRRFVGASGSLVTVVTPAEDSAGTPVTFEVWAGESESEAGDEDEDEDEDEDGWDHEVDIDLDVPGSGLAVLTTAGGSVLGLPAGSYRARISGRGFAAFGPGDNDEEYRIRMWPRDGAANPRVRRNWPGWAGF